MRRPFSATHIGVALAAAAMSLPSSPARAAATYDAFADFSLTAGSSPWSYLWTTPAGSSTVAALPLAETTCNGIVGVECWWSNQPIPDSILVAKDTTQEAVVSGTAVFPTDALLLDPEAHTVEVRFTAPVTGEFRISGAFTGQDTVANGHPVQVLLDGSILFSGTISSYRQSDPFSLTQQLAAGSTLDFAVLTGSTGCSYCFLSSGLSATITPTPEPGSMALMAAGLAVLGWGRGRVRAYQVGAWALAVVQRARRSRAPFSAGSMAASWPGRLAHSSIT